MKLEYSLEYFFVELTDSIEDDLSHQNDTIYVKGTESIIPGIFIKTTKAYEYINQNYDYEYIIRTNLSSFWNIPRLFHVINDFQPNQFAGGIFLFNFVISGTGIFLSKDSCIQLIERMNQCFHIYEHDDVLITKLIQEKYPIHNLTENSWIQLYSNENNVIPQNFDNVLYFRIKSPNRTYDEIAFKTLLKNMYNIDYPNS
jgi:hypothetical protein